LVVVGVLELLPADSAPVQLASETGLNDKALHFIAYAAVGVVPVLGLGFRVALPWLIVTGLVGAGLEVVQFFTTTRSAETADAIANICGILFGIMAAWLFRPVTGLGR
jgi:VanZ family protein